MVSKNLARWVRYGLMAAALSGCGGAGGGDARTGASSPPPAPPSAAAVAGKVLFFDTSLSASGQQACETCHVPSRAFTADPTTDHGLPVPLGGPKMDQTGFRNAPSLMYASFTPPFSLAGGLSNNPTKGNCTACHPSQAQGYDSHALFTDFTFDNIGVPRNWKIPANTPGSVSPIDGAVLTTVLTPVDVPDDAEYAYYDMGLCGPLEPSAADVN